MPKRLRRLFENLENQFDFKIIWLAVILVAVLAINDARYLSLFIHGLKQGPLSDTVDVVGVAHDSCFFKKHQQGEHFDFAQVQRLRREYRLDFPRASVYLTGDVGGEAIELLAELGVPVLDVF